MPTIKQILLGLVLTAGMLLPGQVFADRAPTPEERSSIETVLRNEGFLRWGRIELDEDDDVWEIDGAHASDGRRYALWLHPDTLAIIGREPDDD
jgi:Peptidase propeptide and YPEB domain